jgi:hypothetical protein
MPEMYENHKLCDHLKPSEICFVVEQYTKGMFTQEFHEHVPRSRMSKEARINLLRALVIYFSPIGAEQIVHCYMNERSGKPARDTSLEIRATTHPEPGVLRHYCGGNTVAWCDMVIIPSQFRK